MRVFIVTFGFQSVIQNIISLHNLRVDGVYAGEHMINTICDELGLKRILLIDDSLHNIRALPSKHRGYLVKGSKGLQEQDVEKIMKIVSSECFDAVFIDADLTLFEEHVTSEFVYPFLSNHKSVSSFDVTKIFLAKGSRPLLQQLAKL